MSLKYQIVENNLQEGSYYARVIRGDRKTLADMIPDISKKTSLNEPDIRATVIALAEEVADVLAEGNTAVIDNLITCHLTLSGSFDNKDIIINNNNANLNFLINMESPITKEVTNRITFERQTADTKSPILNTFLDIASGQENAYTAGSIITIKGKHLRFDPAQPDQGVFLNDGNNDTRLTVYSMTGDTQVDALTPANVTGPLSVILRTRYTPNGTLRQGTLHTNITPIPSS